MIKIHGHADEAWAPVADVFRSNFERDSEIGAACALYVDGELVVDLWGGFADREAARPWREDTVVLVWSTTKGATAICAHILVERGELDLDAPVARYWPEFGGDGKEHIPVRWLLSHQAGLPLLDSALTLDEACAWEPVIRALEAQEPLWPPGTQHGYHAKTYGFLVGEVVRRISGKSLGTFFADEVARLLELDAWIGLPDEIEPRIARLEIGPPPSDPIAQLERLGLDSAAASELAGWQATLADPNSWAVRAFTLGGAIPPTVEESLAVYNARSFRAAEHPGSNMVSDARSVARMYAATVGEVDGIRLLRPKTVTDMTVVQTSATPPYSVPAHIQPLWESITSPLALGFATPSAYMPLVGPRSFGHAGAGGSLGFADSDHRIGFGYVMNGMAYELKRANNLVAAIARCID